MRRLAALLALVLAGCGGGTAVAPTVTAPEAPTTAAATTGAETATGTGTDTGGGTDTAGGVEFPATTPAAVLALAGQRPTGVVHYNVTVAGTGTTPGLSFGVELANDGTRARIHQTQEDGETWVGLDLASGAVSYTCTAPVGAGPTCQDGDPDGSGGRLASLIAQVVGNEFVAQVFAPLAVQESGVFVAPNDSQAGVPVSCMAAEVGGRLCATRSGFITQVSAAGVKVLADRVTTDVTPADLDRPTPG